jgi:hypothetical protein
MTNSSGGSPSFDETRSQSSIFQIEIHTRRSLIEGFTWVLGTNKEGNLLGQDDPSSIPFDNNPFLIPSRGINAVAVDTSMAIDPSGKQSTNMANVTIDENVLVFARYNANSSSDTGFTDRKVSLDQPVGDGEVSANRPFQDPLTRNVQDVLKESGTDIRQSTNNHIVNVDISDTTSSTASGWVRMKKFIETEIEPEDRIVIKSLSHTELPFVGDNWEQALKPIFTGYIVSIGTSGAVGSNDIINLTCKCNLHYCEISKFNVSPTSEITGILDRKLNQFFDPSSEASGVDADTGIGLRNLVQKSTEVNQAHNHSTGSLLDIVNTSDSLMDQVQTSATIGYNELVNENATTLLLRLLTTDAFETVPVLTLNRSNNQTPIQYYLQSGVTTQQLSYNNILGPLGPNSPLINNRPNGPNGRLETILSIPFFNSGADGNSGIAQYMGEWNTVLDLCGMVANAVDAEFFADEAGRIVFKFPTHGVGINLLPNNDILPNLMAQGAKVPLVLQDRNVMNWNFNTVAPALTALKVSSGLGSTSISEESTFMQNVVIVRFDGTMTLGGVPIGGGENLISKFGVNGQNLPPNNLYIPGLFVSGDNGGLKLGRAILAQYGVMKGETINDHIRQTATVTAIEDSAFTIGQPVAIEFRLREGDYSDQFGFPRKDFYYTQGIQRAIAVGQTPTMTLTLTAGRRYPELTGFERAYFSFYQYIARRNPSNHFLDFGNTTNNATIDQAVSEMVKQQFGQTDAKAFFTIDDTGAVIGPDKNELNKLTGGPESFLQGNGIDTRRITARAYGDLLSQVNDLTKNSSGWSARVDTPISQLFTRPVRRQTKQSGIIKQGNFEAILEPLLKMNLDKLAGDPNIKADIFPTPNEPVSKVFQGIGDRDLLFNRILNENIDLS